MSISKRITFLVDHYDNGVQRRFAKRIKVLRAIISRIITEGADPGSKVVLNIVKYLPEVNTEWLFKNRGEPFVQNIEHNGNSVGRANYLVSTKMFIRERLLEQLGKIQAIIDQIDKDLSSFNDEQ